MKKHPVIWFQINQSWKCNMNCSYCHVKQDSSYMKDSIINEIIENGINTSRKYKPSNFYFIFLGGEPLLQLPIIYKFSKRINEIPNAKISVWTNGILLNEDIIKIFLRKKIDIVLSANESSTPFILKSINLIKKYQEKTRVSVTVNEKNRQRLPELTKKLLEEGHLVRYYMHYTAFQDKNFITNYITTMKECIEIIDDYIQDRKQLDHMFEFFDLKNTKKKSPYLVGRSIFVFDPDGTVRTALPLRDAGVLGNICKQDDYIEICNNYPNRRIDLPRWTAKGIKKCEECEVVNVCQAGYPIPKYYSDKRFDVPSPYCKAYKELIPEYQKLYKMKGEKIGNKQI